MDKRLTDDGADDAEEEARDELEVFAKRLERQRERVDVGNVVRDDRHGEHDEEEPSETAHGTDQRLAEEPTKSLRVVSRLPCRLQLERRHGERAEAFEEDHGDVEAEVRRRKDFPVGRVLGKVDRVTAVAVQSATPS